MVAVSLKKKKKKKKKKKNIIFFFFKQKTAYEMCDSDWSSDVCSSDLTPTVSKHRLFKWLLPPVLPDHQLIEIGRASCRERVYTKV